MSDFLARSHTHKERQSLWWRFHLDWPLLLGIFLLMSFGLLVLYSASGENLGMIKRQVFRLSAAMVVMVVLAQIPPRIFTYWAFPIFAIGVLVLISVLVFGAVGKGAQRWLDLGIFKFQPAEMMKLSMPLMLAWYFDKYRLPPRNRELAVAGFAILLPTILIAKQPDLGTALLIASSGVFVVFLAGIRWRVILGAAVVFISYAPIHWFFLMHNYQRQRVLTFLNPESDPLGAGYHIIQSKIAIGSGGLYGKGWLNGTQSQLDFLPERHTDFIFSVLAEELGLIGVIVLLSLYLYIIGRCLFLANQSQDSFSRLSIGAIALTFFVYVLVNIGMVTGLLPVVGLPLPLVSYGGTSLVTLMAGFGVVMSLHTHRRLMSQ
ncbi:MAG: rod shape-determining protein RodA [Gammaproteobacteria bacterium CG22_combo_CG10-13_8_21_14_all_40_8]|nr:MAG: rod shape-determining protein RodA [Gammaproteobacteria bacterium CG22_combo_CG10-13_8_21_14_all_40_8]